MAVISRYQEIADILERQIKTAVLKMGDKLPSIRMICREHGVSITTAQTAFYELEAKSLIISRPQSGYFVSYSAKNQPQLPAKTAPDPIPGNSLVEGIFENMLSMEAKEGFTVFSRGVPAPEHLPIPKLHKGMVQALRDLPAAATVYEHLQGNENLRNQIARWSFNWQGHLTKEDVITTAGCMSAISFCLKALTKDGDTVAVESPCFYGILNLAKSMHLNVIELASHPETGVDLVNLENVFKEHQPKACLLVSNFSNPFGGHIPTENKKEVVRLINKYQVPLIEDDLYGDLYFGKNRPACCKSFDTEGMVLWCGSFSKTLAPGYRVGWVAPGRFKEQVIKQKLYHTLNSPPLQSEVIGKFLENGRYETHLRKLRKTLYANYLNYLKVISEAFPEGTKASRPQGGLSLWLELPEAINTVELYEVAFRNKITFSPGRMFTLQEQYTNCLRLSLGLVWNDLTEQRLRKLGELAKRQLLF